MHKLRILVLISFLSLFMVSGCSLPEECLAPGEGFSSVEKRIDVPISQSQEWIDSGVQVSEGQHLALYIEGGVNRCAGKTVDKLVHASVCDDGSAPRYNAAPPYEVHGSGTNISVCPPGVGLNNDAMDKVDTGLIVYNTDQITVNLISKTLKITSCTALPPGVVMDSGSYDLVDGGTIPVTEVCQKGAKVLIDGQEVQLGPWINKEYILKVADIMSPEGNKYFHTFYDSLTSGQNWHVGTEVDLRIKDATEIVDLDQFDCTKPMSDPINERFRKTLSIILNNKCGRLCTEKSVAGDDWGTPCTATYHMPMTTETVEAGGVEISVKVPVKGADGLAIHYAQNLDLYVGNDTSNNRTGDMTFKDVSLSKPLIVEVPDDGMARKILLHFWDPNNTDNIGGYHVRVERQCPSTAGENLYYYVGSLNPNSPHILPGAQHTHLIGNRQQNDYTYTLNVDGPAVSGKLFFAIKTNDVSDGKYTVTLTEKIANTFVSSAISTLLTPLFDVFRGEVDPTTGERSGGAMQTIYESLLSHEIKKLIYTTISLYVAFSSLGILTGIVAISPKDLLLRFVKLSCVAALLTDTSWEFFHQYLFKFFLEGVDYMITVFTPGVAGYADNTFAFLDKTIGMIFNDATLKRVASLLLAGPVGWAYFALMVYALWHVLCASAYVVLVYVVAMVAVSFLISLAPLFITFFLFGYTKQFYDKWQRLLCFFVSQPVAAFAMIGLLNELLNVYLYQALNFGICTDCLLIMDFGPGGRPCVITWYTPNGYGTNLDYEYRADWEVTRDEEQGEHLFGLPISLNIAMGMFAVAWAMKIMVDVVLEMMEGIWQTVYVKPGMAAKSMGEGIKGLVGMDEESKRRRQRAKKVPKDSSEKKEKGVKREKGAKSGEDADTIRSGGAKSGGSDVIRTHTQSSADTISPAKSHGDVDTITGAGSARIDEDTIRGVSGDGDTINHEMQRGAPPEGSGETFVAPPPLSAAEHGEVGEQYIYSKPESEVDLSSSEASAAAVARGGVVPMPDYEGAEVHRGTVLERESSGLLVPKKDYDDEGKK